MWGFAKVSTEDAGPNLRNQVAFFARWAQLEVRSGVPCADSKIWQEGFVHKTKKRSTTTYDSRSKVLYSNFNLAQPTHWYDFSISLCGVMQGNHAKQKLGARFAQGWRKCFHACVDYAHIIFVYISYIVLYVYRFYHQSFSLNLLFVFLSAAVDTADAMHWDDYRASLDTYLVHAHYMWGFCRGFGRTCQFCGAPIWEIKLHFSRKPRTSSAQAKRCIQVEVRNRTPCSTRLLFPPKL